MAVGFGCGCLLRATVRQRHPVSGGSLIRLPSQPHLLQYLKALNQKQDTHLYVLPVHGKPAQPLLYMRNKK